MKLFENKPTILVSAAFARQRFLCSTEYSAGVCHGACCSGPTSVLLTNAEKAALIAYDSSLPVYGRLLKIRGNACPLSLQNGHCRVYGTALCPFSCMTAPFCLNDNGTLIVSNNYMKRACRVKNDKDGGRPAYIAFSQALTTIFGYDKTKFLQTHLDNGGGDITLPVSKYVMESLLAQRKFVNEIKSFGYTETEKLYSEM